MAQRNSTTTKPRSFRWAYLLDEDHIRRLDRMLKEEVLSDAEPSSLYEDEPKELDYSVGFSDDSSLRTSSVDEVVDLPNSRDRRITSITMSEPFWLRDLRVRVSFRQYRSLPSVEYEISGEVSKVLHLADKLDQQLPAVRQWYSPLIRVNFYAVAFVFSLLYALILVILFTLLIGTGPPQVSQGVSTVMTFLPIGILVGGVLLDLLRKRLFPIATFAIGQGVSRNKTLNFWRTFLGITVGVGLILNVVGGLLLTLLN